ncbi:MAG: hypothetical protein QXT67_04755 [Candidatus Bathyarchaeia archaeon]
MFKFGETATTEQEMGLQEKIDLVKSAIAKLYLYRSYADVEIGEKFYKIIESAKSVDYDWESGNLIIDGKKYRFDVEEETYFEYPVSASERKAVFREARRLYREFKKREKNELLAFIENSNPDGYVAAIVWIEPEED